MTQGSRTILLLSCLFGAAALASETEVSAAAIEDALVAPVAEVEPAEREETAVVFEPATATEEDAAPSASDAPVESSPDVLTAAFDLLPDTGPEITVEPILRAELHQGIIIDAEIVDPDGVFDPQLFFRAMGESSYLSIGMIALGEEGRYRGEIPSTAVTGPMEYFIEAYDGEGNGPARSAPPELPHRIFVSTEVLPPEELSNAHAPEILHEEIRRTPKGRSVTVEASFRGPSGLFNPVVFFRRVGTPSFASLSMVELPADSTPEKAPEDTIYGAGETGRWVADIPAALTTGDLEYFIEAMDEQGNGPTRIGSRERPRVILTYEAPPESREPEVIVLGGESLEPQRVDPDVAMMECLTLPREHQTADPARLSECRRPLPETTPEQQARFKFGEIKLGYDNHADAIEAFEALVQEAPEWPAAWFRLGQASERGRRWARAKEAYARYLELVPAPPEHAALIKRLASVDYALSLEERDAAEKVQREEAQRETEERRERLRQQLDEEKRQKRNREMLLSAPGQWALIGLSAERWGEDAELAGFLSARFRFKIPAAPWIFFGGGVWGGYSMGGQEPILALAPLVGLNIFALPAPSTMGFTLLSPFVSYQPRFLLLGRVGADAAEVHHVLSVGNHFEFGRISLEASVGMGVAGSQLNGHLDLAVGFRMGGR